MELFTVIGIWESTGEAFADEVRASDAHDAMFLIARERPDDDLTIVGAVAGFVKMTCPCEDTGKVAAATDILGIEA